ncbi:ATP phosphoribosyltransferase [Malassezia brasiliensis]|uniref:ATP phosphoribosyltransferase n=1 Tax=Malassezia brasiliensis TaxID=1821822 RepID=A0AAF0DT44_9BASI|nr:ATP phosphoribosyltransferase [Malassezia brasiliensis]
MSQLLRPENLQDRLLFAIPKKGRLNETCLSLLSGADIQFKRAHRLDVALVKNLPIALVFLPAADIPHFVANGDVDLGITGHDMVQEAGPAISESIDEMLDLGFGKCQLQVQVPEASETIKTVEDLIGKKIATSFDHLSAKFFRDLEEKVGSKEKTTIAYLNGSVETACALGLADGIETMRACGLKPIATLLASEAKLIRPRTPHARSNTALVSLIAARIRGVIAAKKYVLCQYNIPKVNLNKALAITPGRRAATVSTLEESDWNAVSSMVARDEVANIMDKLEDVGASDILILSIDNCRV